MPQIDTIRDTVKVVEIDGLKVILQHTLGKAVENKVFENGTIDGYTVGAIDGTKFFGSNKKNCIECLKIIKFCLKWGGCAIDLKLIQRARNADLLGYLNSQGYRLIGFIVYAVRQLG